MGLKIMRNADGSVRETWHGRVSVKGVKHTYNLGVPIEGRIPMSKDGDILLSAKGDEAFERSRKRALAAFEKWRKETRKDPAELQRAAYLARTKEDVNGLPLSKLYMRWCKVKRARKPTLEWQKMMRLWFNRFTAFAGTYARRHGVHCETINDVTPEIAGAWFEEIRKTYSWETVIKMMVLMRGAFRRYSTNGRANPFSDIVLRGGGTSASRKVSRKPLESKQLERLFSLAREDEFLYPLIVTAACTGMRIGDVCNLKWADVDLASGLIECVTSKAGVRVWIPILGRLMEVLKEREAVPGDGTKPSPFVFPKAAAQYNPHPKLGKDGRPIKDRHGKPVMTDGADSIYRAAQPYFGRAVFGDDRPVETVTIGKNGKALDPPSREEAINAAGFAEKKRLRMLEVCRRHAAGEKSKDIAEDLGVARSQVSMDLRDVEKLTGETLRPLAVSRVRMQTRLEMAERTRQQRVDAKGRRICKRAASIYGWHSLRHTFVVLALDAGVPVEKVRQIVGHGEAETTINNYYNPTKAHEAERVRQQMRGTVLEGRRKGEVIPARAPVPSLDDIVAGLSVRQKKALARKLLGL